MAKVLAQDHRDLAIFQAWVDGAHQDALATQYGIDQSSISRAISRTLAQLPEVDQAEEIRRTLRLVDDLLTAYVPSARAGKPAANREVRGLLALRAKYLGVDRREVQVQGQFLVEHRASITPELAQLIRQRQDQNRAVRAQLQRLDQDQTRPVAGATHQADHHPGDGHTGDLDRAQDPTAERVRPGQGPGPGPGPDTAPDPGTTAAPDITASRNGDGYRSRGDHQPSESAAGTSEENENFDEVAWYLKNVPDPDDWTPT